MVNCTMYNQLSISDASIFIQNIPILTFPHLHSFSIFHICPNKIFKCLQLPIIRTLHMTYQEMWKRKTSKDLKWFARQPFMSLLSCCLHTLRKLMIDHLHGFEDSAHIAHCLRATPLLEELCLRGSGCWITTGFVHLLTCQANIDVLVPGLQILEIGDDYILHNCSMSMVEFRWWVRDDDDNIGTCLKG